MNRMPRELRCGVDTASNKCERNFTQRLNVGGATPANAFAPERLVNLLFLPLAAAIEKGR
jgi:hypothetical protein